MQERPVYLDLTKIRLPMSAFSSITHRLSGMYVFFITLPLFLYVIYTSTLSKSSYELLLVSLNTTSVFSIFFYISVSIFFASSDPSNGEFLLLFKLKEISRSSESCLAVKEISQNSSGLNFWISCSLSTNSLNATD